ncbi:MAG TPA: reductive dehalogenase domain-containing protein [Candidatus Kapabacteria bacterium]|jgi:ferredoxin|nr:reductive dehalogenase domain-containing protein [Candidatus Kapabacteria bacterium]
MNRPIQISLDAVMAASDESPPAFAWEEWYEGVGGRTIDLPEVRHYHELIFNEQIPRFTGEVAPTRHEFASAAEASAHIKARALELGADIVGICEIEPSDIYRGRGVTERYAIALGQRMRYREFQTVPSREAAIECMRIYYSLGQVVIDLADHIRSLGYSCEVEHPVGDSNLLHIPIGLKAGFGELGRHGSIIHPKLGPLFRMGSVATSIPMEIDHPIDAGIARFCDTCRACRIYCPADAVPDERSPEAGRDHLGNDRYVVDTGRCFPYFAKHYYCSACLPVCVYNHKEWARDFEGFQTRIFPEVIMTPPPAPFDGVDAEHRHAYPPLKRQPGEPGDDRASTA